LPDAGIAFAKIVGMRQRFPMSVVELKRAVDTLSVEDRLELADYLRRTSKEKDPQCQAEIGRRLDACLQGKGQGTGQLVALPKVSK
jgi:hypothetical protein